MRSVSIYLVCLVLFFVSCKKNEKLVEKKKGINIQVKYAEILKTDRSEIKNVKLYSFIDKWYGVKYKYGGLTYKGVDCSGFCNILYSNVYKKSISRDTKSLAKETKKIGKKNLTEGDLVFFNISNKMNSHVGIYLTNNRFVHASTSKGVIISDLDNPYYKKYFNKGGRYK